MVKLWFRCKRETDGGVARVASVGNDGGWSGMVLKGWENRQPRGCATLTVFG